MLIPAPSSADEQERIFDISHGPDGLETEADHSAAFNASLGRSIQQIVFRGLVCISAKRQFPRRYEAWIKHTLNCSRSFAHKCRVIAENKFLRNASNWKRLPASTAALYALSGISARRLENLAKGGELHCHLTITEAIALGEAEKGDYRPRRASASAAPLRRMPEDADDDADVADEIEFSGASAAAANAESEDGDIDIHRLLIDAEDVAEVLRNALARCRRRIESIQRHSSPTAKSMLASDLRDVASSLIFRADALDPPTGEAAEDDADMEVSVEPEPLSDDENDDGDADGETPLRSRLHRCKRNAARTAKKQGRR